MNVLLPLLIVAINPDAPIEARYPGATEIFHCPFDAAWDRNFDHWPDEWTRRRGPGFPRYVTVEIREESTPVGGHCLRIDLNGGAAAVYSPPIPVAPWDTYVLEGVLATEGLQRDWAYLSVTLLDNNRRQLETCHSERIRDSQGWRKLRVGPVTAHNDRAELAIIGLHLDPGSPPDLTGSVRLGDVWLARLGRISLAANSLHHVYTDADAITVTCNAWGLSTEAPLVVFQLEDVSGTLIAEERQQLTTVGSILWSPPVPGPGFYRVRAAVHDRDKVVHRQELSLAVVRARSGLGGGEFGWTLPQGDEPLPSAELVQLIGQAGIGWVKYPLWLDEQTSDEQIQEVNQLGQDLGSQGIQLIGLLHSPPESLRKRFPTLVSPAEIFLADPNLWYPSLASAITRTGVPVRWWQLGHDRDTGLVGYPKLAEKMAKIKGQLDQISPNSALGFGWDWRTPLPEPAGGEPAWQFLSLSADPPLSDHELVASLSATEQAHVRRWVVLEPAPRDGQPLEARAADLVRGMLLAKIHGAEGIFIPDPFSTDRGLMNDDGSVGELFLPWRTAALMLGGARYVGQIELPDGSPNHVFSHGAEAVMVVWNEAPKQEVIYLGDDVEEVDVWGRSAHCGRQEHRQVIEAGPLPTFLTGVDERIVRWRQSFALADDRVLSVADRPRANGFRLTNSFDGEVSGHLELVGPQSWGLNPRRTDFRLAPHEKLEQAFQITLPYDAASGRHPIRVDFELQHADRTLRFSVYRHLVLGPSDVHIEVATRLNESGELEVEQRFVNDAETPVSFRCHLFAPERRRLNTHVIGLKRGRQVDTYRLSNGRQLIGKTLWLRAEQIDGPCVLNYRFVAEG